MNKAGKDKQEKKRIFLLETSGEDRYKRPDESYHLGLAYLDAILKKEGYDVVTKDFTQEKERDCLRKATEIIRNFKPELIGISVMSMTRVSTYKLIKIIKKIDKKIKVILGSFHPSIMYEQLLLNFPIDAIVIGEGEETIKELVPALLNGKKLDKIKGIAFKKNKKVIRTKDRELIQNLDELPFPSHELFITPNRKKIWMLSSRGCPNKCIFCCMHVTSRGKFRTRSAENIIDELEHIKEKYPQIDSIEFSDDAFTVSEERVIELCNEIIKRKIKLNFHCCARIKPSSYRMFKAMQDAGFTMINFGVETGSERMLKIIRKNITPEDIIETFKILSHFPKIKVCKFLMVGFPGENEESVKETIELSKKLNKIIPMNYFYVSPVGVYPGTAIYEKMKEAGKIDDGFWLTEKPCQFYTVEYTSEEIVNMSNRIALETCLDKGYLYFITFLFRKFFKESVYNFKRLVQGKFLIPAIIKKHKG